MRKQVPLCHFWTCNTSVVALICIVHLQCCLISAFCEWHVHSTFLLKRVGHEENLLSCKAVLQDVIPSIVSDNDIKLTNSNEEQRTHLIFPGGGIYFYWQAGFVTYLREKGYDLSSCTFSGASAGALTATLTSTGVDFYDATDLALKLASDAGVWNRSGGLQGIWGEIVEDWLDELLPESVEDYTNNERLSLLVTPIPTFGKTRVCEFRDKEDLIRCNMASIHLPWFLDGQLTTAFRDAPHIDGSFLAQTSDYYPTNLAEQKFDALVLDWKNDPAMQSKGGLDFVEALSPDGIWGLVNQGKSYARAMESDGKFQCLER